MLITKLKKKQIEVTLISVKVHKGNVERALSKLKKKVKDYIEENKNFKKALDKYLQIDYFVYQQILNNNQFWYWQLGKVLKYET